MEIPTPALFLAHLFVFGLVLCLYLGAVAIWSPEPRKGVVASWLAAWVAFSGAATTLAVTGFGAAAWALWFATFVGGVVVLTRAIIVRRKIAAGRKAAQLPSDWTGPLTW